MNISSYYFTNKYIILKRKRDFIGVSGALGRRNCWLICSIVIVHIWKSCQTDICAIRKSLLMNCFNGTGGDNEWTKYWKSRTNLFWRVSRDFANNLLFIVRISKNRKQTSALYLNWDSGKWHLWRGVYSLWKYALNTQWVGQSTSIYALFAFGRYEGEITY